MTVTVHSLADRPDLAASAEAIGPLVWPEFMFFDPTGELYFSRLEHYAEYVVVAEDDAEPGTAIARGCSVPFAMESGTGPRGELPVDGWDRVLWWADADRQDARPPTVVSALEIIVRPETQQSGFSRLMVEALRANTRRLGFDVLVAPVRPNQKHLEPFTPMEDYAARRRPDGLPADGWMRVHVRLGATIEKVAPTSMTIRGSLRQWRAWTGLPFDCSGEVVVPGALVPVHVSLEQDHAVYVEPNVWLRHDLSGP
jgi:GNAT superfamily N-acetyltransferase